MVSDVEEKNKQTQNTLAAIARIAEEQRRRPDQTLSAAKLSTASMHNSARTLPSGYISGGNQRVDSQAEVMRLTATIDTLNSKMASQSDRLQRTEASLVRANRAITSERAIANARLLKMQNDVKEMRAREASTRESVVLQAQQAQKSAASFEESAKRAEEYDLKVSKLSNRIQILVDERAASVSQISELEAKLRDSVASDAEARAEINASVNVAAKDEDCSEELTRLRTSLDESVTENKKVVTQLAIRDKDYDSVRKELDELTESHKKLSVAATTVQERLGDVERETTQRETSLLEENSALRAKVEQMSSTSCVYGIADVDEVEEEATEPFPDSPLEDESIESNVFTSWNASCTTTASGPFVVFEKQPPPLRSHCAADTRMVHPVCSRIASAMHSAGHGKRLGTAAPINPMIGYRITRAPFNTNAVFTSTTETGDAAQIPAEVAALIEAVSKDISHACVQRRSEYLKAYGMSEKEIQKELSSYA
jgi:hypothetical protein